MKNYASYSYWLETCGDDLTPRPRLNGTIDADIAILGAGFSGLWTAWYLLDRNPELKIAILEREIAGFGASGRNGGWCTSGFPTSLGRIEQKYGKAQAIATHRAMTAAVDEVGKVASEQGIDIDWQKSGSLMTARGTSQLPSVHDVAKTMSHLGFEDEYQLLDKKQLDERIRIAGSMGAIFLKQNAVIHPGKLVRGLARAVEKRGATIYEQSDVTSFSGGAYPALHTEHGHVRAGTVILCGESYMSGLEGVGRQLMPVYSLITLTEPLSEREWEAIGWQDRELVDSCRYTVDYLSKTIDGRILFGGRGAPYHLRSKIKDSYDRHDETHKMLQRQRAHLVPGAEGREVHAHLGRTVRLAAGLHANHWLRPQGECRHRPRIHRSGRGDDKSGGPHPRRSDHRRRFPDHPIAAGRSSLAQLGTGTLPLPGSALRPARILENRYESRAHRRAAFR